ncbi:hypothetical protein POM88_009216 [Heracleum sosnowskyi]|uniref:Uncharacterized protein n=1 Tax=Heracleum sosnowskyi TaxID=360622 RepID=A0AAD8J8Q9_9APIA|nr:hypothetical protein POM88_009216 [Heracleum sosnowskyi]
MANTVHTTASQPPASQSPTLNYSAPNNNTFSSPVRGYYRGSRGARNGYKGGRRGYFQHPSSSSIACQICGYTNHLVATCRRRFDQFYQPRNTQQSRDTGATHHVTPDLSALSIANEYIGTTVAPPPPDMEVRK